MLNSEETLAQKFIKKWSWIFLFTLLIAPLGYIVRIVLTSDISPSEIGILYGIISLLMLLWVYNDFWLTESLNYFLPKYIIKNDYARCKYLLTLAFSTQLITSIVLGAWLFLFADFLAIWHFKDPIAGDVIRVMSLFFLGINMMQVTSIIFSASQNTKFQKGTEFFRMFMTMLGIVGLFFADQWTLLTYAWAWIIALYLTVIFISILGYIYYYRPYFRGVTMNRDISLRRTFIRYSVGTFVWSNIGMLLHHLDQQILQNMTNSAEGGLYAMYLSLIGIPFIFFSPILGFLFPVISEIHSRWQIQKIQSIQSIFSNTMFILMLWASGLFIILGTNIALFLYGSAYAGSGQALIYIAPFLVLNILIQINFQIMAGTGMIRERVWILWKTLILNIALVILMITGFKNGILPFPNAASATSFSVGFSWILMWFLSHRATRSYHGEIDMPWIWKNLFTLSSVIWFYLYFDIWSKIPNFWLDGRAAFLSEILFVFLWSIIIFLLLNFRKMQEFIFTIQRVRKEKI